MKREFKRYFQIIAFLFALFLVPLSAAAALVPNCAGYTCTICSLLQLISNIALFLVSNVMPPLAGLLFLVGGIMMIAAAGSEERYKKGRKIVIDTAIGAVIVLVSWLIVNALITTIGSAASIPGFSVQNWWHPTCP
jgi:hypothetical protein